jgi:hypothetical protein
MKTVQINLNKQKSTSKNNTLGIYILSITLVVVSYSVAAAINFL